MIIYLINFENLNYKIFKYIFFNDYYCFKNYCEKFNIENPEELLLKIYPNEFKNESDITKKMARTKCFYDEDKYTIITEYDSKRTEITIN